MFERNDRNSRTISLNAFCLSFIVGLSDAFYVDFWLAILAEYLATLFFLFAVSGSALRWEGAPTIFQQALAAGLCTASSIQAFRSVSLPLVHANPAVSLATFITGDAGLVRMVCSILAQMFGGRVHHLSWLVLTRDHSITSLRFSRQVVKSARTWASGRDAGLVIRRTRWVPNPSPC